MLLSYKKVIAISHQGLGAKLLELPYFILQVTIFLHQALDMLQNMYTYGCFCDVRSCSLMNNLPPPIVFQVFSSVFILEAVLKLSALTRHYFKNSWNIFDLVIVVISILDMTLTTVDGLSVIRIFRLVRLTTNC